MEALKGSVLQSTVSRQDVAPGWDSKWVLILLSHFLPCPAGPHTLSFAALLMS